MRISEPTIVETARLGGLAGFHTEATSTVENRKEEHRRGYDGLTSHEERRELEREEKDRNLVAGIHLQVWEEVEVEVDGATSVDLRRIPPSSSPPMGDEDGEAGLKPFPPNLDAGPPSLHHSLTLSLPPSSVPLRSFHGSLTPSSTSTILPVTRDHGLAGTLGKVRGKPLSISDRGLAELPNASEDPQPPRLKQRTFKVNVVPKAGTMSTIGKNQHGGEDSPVKELKPASTSTQSTPQPMEPRSTTALIKPSPKSAKSMGPPKGIVPAEQRKTESTVKQNKAFQAKPTALPELRQPAANATTLKKAKLNQVRNIKRNENKGSTTKSKPMKGKNRSKTTTVPTKMVEVTTTPYFPYFKDTYCPPECDCYGGVVQCSDKGVDKVPYGIPYNARYILLMNNLIDSLQSDLFREYLSMEFLVLSNNRLADAAIKSAFQGVQALKRLFLDSNLLESVPADLPPSLEELRLDNNRVRVMSEAAWVQCPGLLVLSLRNNSLGNGSEGLPNGALSPLGKLRTLSLDGNGLAWVPLGLPLSIRELYLRGNRIRLFRGGVFAGPSQLAILDLSGNQLTNKGLVRDSLLNATRLESLNLEGNALGRVPRHLPPSLKTLNLEGNLIASVGRSAFRSLPNLEHLGMARNQIFRVAPGAFGTLAALHQLDLCHNALSQVPRRLPQGLHSAALTHNRIRTVPPDAFCWEGAAQGTSGLVRVQLEYNLIDLGAVDVRAFRCLRGPQVVRFF
ncbi:unnamed protein product [Lota lota]